MSQNNYPQNGQGYYPPNGQGYYPPGGYQNPYPNIQSPIALSIVSTVLSVLSTFCCCLPLGIISLTMGIVSIVFATKVNSLLSVGNFQAAKEAADKAKMWGWISLGVCLVGIVLGIIVSIIYILPHLNESGFELN